MSLISVVCGACGADLKTEISPWGDLKVTPCEACMGQVKEEGRDLGYEDGFNAGVNYTK